MTSPSDWTPCKDTSRQGEMETEKVGLVDEQHQRALPSKTKKSNARRPSKTEVSRLDSSLKIKGKTKAPNGKSNVATIKPTDLKACNVCGKEKPISEFYKRRGICKKCCNKQTKIYTAKHYEETKKYQDEYRKSTKKFTKKQDKNEKYCLKCGEIFISEGMFNRICHSCNKINAGIY